MINQHTLSVILQAARKNQRITLTDLAEEVGISENTLKRTLTAPEHAPLHRLDKLCKALNVHIRLELGNT